MKYKRDEGWNIRRVTTLANSKNLHEKQLTQNRDRPEEIEMEFGDKRWMQSNSVALPNKESVNDDNYLNNIRLIDKVLGNDNILVALQRMEKNKGSNSVDGMKFDELQEHIRRHWTIIKSKILEGK